MNTPKHKKMIKGILIFLAGSVVVNVVFMAVISNKEKTKGQSNRAVNNEKQEQKIYTQEEFREVMSEELSIEEMESNTTNQESEQVTLEGSQQGDSQENTLSSALGEEVNINEVEEEKIYTQEELINVLNKQE